jgi:uridine kinase
MTLVHTAQHQVLVRHIAPPAGKRARGVRRFRVLQTGAVDEGARAFADLARDIRARPGLVRLIGIDGCGGAGKSTFAARLSNALDDAPVIHTDDFASHDVPTEWWPRMLSDVIEPLLHGEPASYHPYDWVARRVADATITIEPRAIVLIEGVGATRKAWRDRLALRVWVDCPRDLRLHRGIERDGEELREFWLEWMQAEDAYLEQEHPYAYADVTVDGATPGPDPETQYVEMPRLTEPR